MKIEHPSEYNETFVNEIFTAEIQMAMEEAENEFILKMIQPYTREIMERYVPKEVIKQALLTYSKEHPTEMATLMARYREE